MALESKLQTRIIKALKKDGWLVNKVITCSNSGWPDIEAFKRNNDWYTILIFIEVKSPGKKARPLQEFVHDRIKKHGGRVYTVDSWEQFKSLDI